MGWHQLFEPGIVSGVFFALSWFLMIDAAIVAGHESSRENHFNFVHFLPILLATVGFGIVNVTSPDMAHLSPSLKSQLYLFFGWALQFGSTLIAVTICGHQYVGENTMIHGYPGIALVLCTCFVPIATVTLWVSKRTSVVEVW